MAAQHHPDGRVVQILGEMGVEAVVAVGEAAACRLPQAMVDRLPAAVLGAVVDGRLVDAGFP
jgi:hypothetical protein